jgi:hypothetical protein
MKWRDRIRSVALLYAAGAATLVACVQDAAAPRLEDERDAGPSALLDAAPALDAGELASDADASSLPSDHDATAVDVAALTDAASELGDSGVPAERTLLVTPAAWKPLAASDDPFTDRPAVVSCPSSAAMAEVLGGEGGFSVDTGACNYVTVTQGTRREVLAGELIKVRLWHFELSAPEPAEAHAALLLDGLSILDERIPIPQPGGLITRQLRVTRAIPMGAPVYFHLHNHGANSWSLVEISAGP